MNLPVHHRPGRLPALRWGEPLVAEFDDLFERMNRFMEAAGVAPAAPGAWAPLADMRETDDAYVVEAELPGIKRGDIDVEIDDRELRISGEYKERERKGILRRGTRRTGHFEYRALLPADVKADEITATLADGVLTVTVPKAKAAKPRHIEITEP